VYQWGAHTLRALEGSFMRLSAAESFFLELIANLPKTKFNRCDPARILSSLPMSLI